ncbi:MAG: hypothetical protein J5I90_08110 [Caldilineales bacterium]|nr:hypothetical protein [Caldilineales bacterium]
MKDNNRWLTLTGGTLAVIILAGVLILPGIVSAQGAGPWNNGQTSCNQDGSGWQGGMMGRITGMFGNMMGGSDCGGWSGGMMGSGMMGGFNNSQSGPRITLDEAHAIAERYAETYNAASPLVVKEVMEFNQNFYAEVVESDTGSGAFEILIDPVSGNVHPEYGPNMMWNTKYGMHGGGQGGLMGMMGGFFGGMMGGNRSGNRSSGEMTVTPEQAIAQAQDYLDQSLPGLTVGDEVDRFYGYYTLHTLKDGQIEGMLSVNGSNGQVWYHSWHGEFIDMTADAHD